MGIIYYMIYKSRREFMELYKGNLYWPTTTKAVEFESLKGDKDCDITVIGGGMSGMLCAYYLSLDGYRVILIEKDKIGRGSSSGNTGLLQYSSDIMMHNLAEEIGEKDAFLFYKMSYEAMEEFRALPEKIKKFGEIYTRDSIYFASEEDDLKELQDEYKMLRKYNFPVDFLKEIELFAMYGILSPGAMISHGDAEINPFKFIHSLAENAPKDKLSIFENTKALKINYTREKIEIETDRGAIESKYIILATGYEGNKYKEIKKGDINTTYAIATNSLDYFPWKDKSMIWETARPYLYARMTEDNRIIAGGLDEDKETVSSDESLIHDKGEEILANLKSVIPNLDAHVEYSWNAIFGESTDELPFIGVDPDDKRVYYCLGFGGNGTVYSMSGAKIILDLIKGKKNPYAHIVKIDR